MSPAEAWQAVVAGEHAAVFAYSVAGARLGTGARSKARRGLDSHRSHRNRASALALEAGGTPPAPAAAYEFPFEVDSPAAARRLLALVDNRLVALYADAADAVAGSDRRWPSRAAAENATRAVSWGEPSQAFPSGESGQ